MDLWMTADTRHHGMMRMFAEARDIMVPAFNAHFATSGSSASLIELHFDALLHPPLIPLYGESKRYLRNLHAACLRTRVEVPLDCDLQLMLQQLSGALAFSSMRAQRLNIPHFSFIEFSVAFRHFASTQGWTASCATAGATAAFHSTM